MPDRLSSPFYMARLNALTECGWNNGKGRWRCYLSRIAAYPWVQIQFCPAFTSSIVSITKSKSCAMQHTVHQYRNTMTIMPTLPALCHPSWLISTERLANVFTPKANHYINCWACPYKHLSCCALEEGALFATEADWWIAELLSIHSSICLPTANV